MDAATFVSYLITEDYWWARFWFYRGLFLTYFLAFMVAHNQYLPLVGEDGILPFTGAIEQSSFWERPSVLFWDPSDRTVRGITTAGLLLSLAGLAGLEFLGTVVVAPALLVLWVLYLSLVQVGRLFHGYGWESFLCETGALAVFLGGANHSVPTVILFLFGWLLFRVMFGAGLIKIRGDQCWRDLTCMDYHYETQPMPNPLSWLAHHLPRWWHKVEVFGNHVTELIVPFLYFAPQPLAGVAGLMTIGFQGWLMLTGNFSWLNFLTAVIALPLIPDVFFTKYLPVVPGAPETTYSWVFLVLGLAYATVVVGLSYYPARNLFSRDQLMNAGFDPLKLVNTYGAFGSITKTRYELVVQARKTGEEWQTYEFKGKPTDPERRPAQWAPYHLRLDWQMWFAAMRSRPPAWFYGFLQKVLEGDERILGLLEQAPYGPENPPDEIRVLRYEYRFATPGEGDGDRWWERANKNVFVPATRDPKPGGFRSFLR